MKKNLLIGVILSAHVLNAQISVESFLCLFSSFPN